VIFKAILRRSIKKLSMKLGAIQGAEKN